MISIAEIDGVVWVALLAAAVLIGVTKTAIPGFGVIAVAMFAAFLPAKTSTAIVLLLLVVADLFATVMYRKYVQWGVLWRLMPSVLVGLLLGAVFLHFANDGVLRRSIGIIIVGLTVIAFARKLGGLSVGRSQASATVQKYGFGALSGFTTMVANAGGAAMSLYLLASKLPVTSFLGTSAWFFAMINLTKLPIMFGLGMFSVPVAQLALALIPGVLVGIAVGRIVGHRINQTVFEWLVLSLTLVGGVYLVL